MSKEGIIKKLGIVKEVEPNTRFLVQIDNEIVRCYLSGKMIKNKISVILGDKVEIELSESIPITNQIGRITFRRK